MGKAVATPTPKDEISEIAEQVQILVAERPLRVTTEEEQNAAGGWLARARKKRKEWEAFSSKLLKPFREAISKHNMEWNNLLAPLRQYETELDIEIRDYRAREARKAAAAQAKLDAQHERRVEKAIEQGKDPALVKPPPVVAAPAKTVETDGGKVTFKQIPKFKVLDESLVPDEFWAIDEVKLGKEIRAGRRDIPGVHIWMEEVSSVHG